MFQDLKVLECRGCSIHHVSPRLYNYTTQLTHLDLGDNEISILPADEYKLLTKLSTLKLDGNHLQKIHDYTFNHQLNLRKLNLARNRLDKIDGNALNNLHNLIELDLGYNKLKFLELYCFDSIVDSLEKLVLNDNYIPEKELFVLLENMKSLKELHLAGVGLAVITTNFIPKTVRVLNLADNYLSSLPSYVLPNNLIELDISRNRFRGLDEDTVNCIENVPKIKFEGNPWSCDLCHILPLLSKVNTSIAIYNIKCSAPYYFQGKLLGNIQQDDLGWCSGPRYSTGDANFFLTDDEGKLGVIAAGASVLLLIATVLAILAALCYSRRHSARYYTHEDKRVPQSELYDTGSPLFCDEKELSFKFDLNEKKISIATIDEIKKDHALSNGT